MPSRPVPWVAVIVMKSLPPVAPRNCNENLPDTKITGNPQIEKARRRAIEYVEACRTDPDLGGLSERVGIVVGWGASIQAQYGIDSPAAERHVGDAPTANFLPEPNGNSMVFSISRLCV